MKVLILYPPTGGSKMPGIPLSIFYLAGALRRGGVECDVLDGHVEGLDAVVAAVKRGYDVVGINTLSNTRWITFDTAALVKKLSPHSKVVLGGQHVTVMAEQVMESIPHVDACIKGQAEFELLRWVREGAPMGVIYDSPLVDIDSIPWPAWDACNFGIYSTRARSKWDFGSVNGVRLRKYPKVSVTASRGCKNHCTFCSWTTWRNHRVRDPQDVAAEIGMLVKHYGQRHFFFTDDSFGTHQEKTLKLCELLEPMKVAWSISMRVDDVTEEGLRAYRRAGCYGIHFGLESGSPEILSGSIHKNADVGQAEWAVRKAKENGMWVYAGVIVGMPGENEKTVKETRAFLRRTKPHSLAILAGAIILPGTALYAKAKREGVIDEGFWLTRVEQSFYLRGFTREELERWRMMLVKFNWLAWLKETWNEIKRLTPMGKKGWAYAEKVEVPQ